MKKPIILLILILINIMLVYGEQKNIRIRINVNENIEENHFDGNPKIIYESSSVKARKLVPFFILHAVSLIVILFIWNKF